MSVWKGSSGPHDILVYAETSKEAAAKFVKEVVRISGEQLCMGRIFSVCDLKGYAPTWFATETFLTEYGYDPQEPTQ